MTVRLSTEIGSDLKVIKEAAERRALTLLETLVDCDSEPSAANADVISGSDAISTGAR